MQDASELRRAIAAHLDYYRELGIAGINRDPVWSARRVQAAPIAVDAVETVAVDSSVEPAIEPIVASTIEVESTIEPAIEPITIITASGNADASDDMPRARDPRLILDEIRTDIGPACTRCKLHKLGRKQIVFGVGNPKAELMFVGEAPGRDEDEQGEPFVGRAGQLLTKIIEAINLKREDVYIANVIKCRPPENRNPEPDEVATCEPFLFRQIDAIKPKVIVALGTFAAHAVLKTDMPISRLRGRTYSYRGAQLIATFHPAYLLRSPERKRDTWEDMKKVRALLRGEDA
jgi:uracil-DNA glycosylase family 4